MKKPPNQNLSSAFIDYGIDVPWIMGLFFWSGLFLSLTGWVLIHQPVQEAASGILGAFYLLTGFVFLIIGWWTVWTSWRGKKLACGQLLEALGLSGKKRLLDLGCGRGMVLVSAAKRLPQGQVVGLDDWSQRYLFSNNRQRTLLNAQAEGVEKRVKVATGDMRRLPFPAAHFDGVTAHLALHRLKERQGRFKALQEVKRVLKKKGRLALQDFQYTHQILEDLGKLGFKEIKISGPVLIVFPPVRRITAVKK